MSILKVHYFIKALAVLSLILFSIKYWEAGVIGLSLLLSPYVLLYFLSSEKNYRNNQLTMVRITPALISFFWVAWVLLGFDTTQQTGVLVFNIGLIVQISLIIAAECIIALFMNRENCT